MFKPIFVSGVLATLLVSCNWIKSSNTQGKTDAVAAAKCPANNSARTQLSEVPFNSSMTGTTDLAQSFVTSENITISEIGIQLMSNTATNPDPGISTVATVQIQGSKSENGIEIPDDAKVLVSTNETIRVFTSVGSYGFTFGKGISLKAGQRYWIRVSLTTAVGATNVFWTATGGNPDPKGTASLLIGGIWNGNSVQTRDFNYYTTCARASVTADLL